MVPPGPFIIPKIRCRMRRCGIWRRNHPGKDLPPVSQELLYQSTVETDSWTSARINPSASSRRFSIRTGSQRKIMLRQGRRTIKSIWRRIRARNRRDCGCARALFLFVKVRENWGVTTPTATVKWDLSSEE